MNSKKSKRYLGMTVAQLGILGCLFAIACGTIAGGGLFISGSASGGGFSLLPSPVPTSTPQPTPTIFLTETPSLTPTATIIPYEELIPPGWNQYTTENIELWVPPQFEPVDIEKELQDTIKLYRDLGEEDLASELEDNPPAIVFWFRVSGPGNSLYPANISAEPMLLTTGNLDDFLDHKYTDEPQQFYIVSRGEFQVGNYQARRVLLEGNLNNVYLGLAQYAIYDGTNVWIINCVSHFNEFYGWQPEFDKIARTFRLIGQ